MDEKKTTIQLILQDLKTYWPGVVAAAVYCIAMTLAFGRMCPVVLITGYPCPGCGLTRGFLSMVTFHFREAVKYNACIFLWAAAGIWIIVRRYFLKKKAFTLVILLAVSGITMIYYIWRMIFCFPSEDPMVYRTENLIGLIRSFQGIVR